MGDLQALLQPQPTGVLTEESPSQWPNPHPLSIGAESWRWAEQATREIICRIQPTAVSEQRRKDVVDYVQSLIRGLLSSEVFPFGSVPLKTYLPDGDIDLTALSHQNVEDALANDVRGVLEGEEQNNDAVFEVKDVQYIHAEVKLVKCLVQNIVVDISFNQLGGLCALCFLEEVDRLIGKDHIFKRSIILIKAWCYYESRILGAHHGLISTYALETLVLYIFHLFHGSLNGPLAVLYRFLDYYSKFDWDNYCVSLNGPVALSSLPEIVAEMPETDGGNLLLSKEFLRKCVDKFSVPARGHESTSRLFPQKHLNIVDPLKENNNLGRSVSKGNFYRIRSAFSFGARKLGRILLFPGEGIVNELNKFFMNTLDRHGSGRRPDVKDPLPCRERIFGNNDSGEKCTEDIPILGSLPTDSHSVKCEVVVDHQDVLQEEIAKLRILESENKHGMAGVHGVMQSLSHRVAGNELQKNNKLGHALLTPGFDSSKEDVSGFPLGGEAEETATTLISGPVLTNEMHKPSPPTRELSTKLFGRIQHAPLLHSSQPRLENGKIENRNPDQTRLRNFITSENKSTPWTRTPNEEISHVSLLEPDGIKLARSSTFPSCTNQQTLAGVIAGDSFLTVGSTAYPPEDSSPRNQSLAANDYLNFREPSSSRSMDSAGPSGSPEALNGLADLNGDFDSHMKSLEYGQWFHEHVSCNPVLPVPPTSPSQFHSRPSWDALHRSGHLKRNVFPHMNANGAVTGPAFSSASGYYPVNPPLISGAFGVEEMPKPRGTGTYFPNMNLRSYREKSTLGRGRNSAPVNHGQVPRTRNNGRAIHSDASNLPEKGSHELLPQAQPGQSSFFGGNGRGKLAPLEYIPTTHHASRAFSHSLADGFTVPPERLEFGTFGSFSLSVPSLEHGWRPEFSGIQHPKGSGSVLPTSAMTRPGSSSNQERVTQSYRLKDEDDFPPLSV